MKSSTMRNVATGVFISGVFFIALGIVLLVRGGGSINFVTMGAGAVQLVNGFSFLRTADRAEKLEKYDG